MVKKTILSTVLTSLMVAVALPAVATEAILRIPARRAKGIESRVVEVRVYPYNAGSTVINFRPTQEKIRQVSLGGGSLSLSSDEPGCLSSESKGSGEPCEATILYLQQKPRESVHPSLRTRATRMSVITDKNIYVFQVVLASGSPVYSVIEIQPDTQNYIPLVSVDEIATLVEGFKVAVEREYLSHPELNRRIREFLEIIKTEKTIEEAAARAGISMEVVRKLQELGNSLPSQVLTPIVP